MTFNVLIVGLGQIGMGYDLNLDSKKYVYSHASAFDQHEGFNLIGGVDTDSELCKVFEGKYGGKIYSDTIEALRENEPDIVVIATSTESHKQILQDVIEYSQPKVILCEKPLSYSLKEANEIHELCKDNNIKLFVNYIRNSDPNVIEIHRKINSGEYAGYAKGVVWYSKGLVHNGSHFINLMDYWFGKCLDVKVINKGEGIPQKYIDRLTERFFRVDKARSRQIGGTGLGLAIVKHILIRHRAQLSINSIPDEETTFSLTFPLVDVK